MPENELEARAPRRQRRLARLQGDGRQQVRTRAGALRRDQGEPEADAPRRPVGRPPRRDRGEPEANAVALLCKVFLNKSHESSS